MNHVSVPHTIRLKEMSNDRTLLGFTRSSGLCCGSGDFGAMAKKVSVQIVG